ncbi:TetR/AcrR family transcriptional regulator [Massilia sp. P8910]|nr:MULTISPECIES: TetR/AcrR family transcriptional regulator [Massilia]MCE3603839.1 TetR/AcrR family transcriptional regulator [Massilia antarctica]MCY0911233.1 TetR/AcrR family transcriptional regulator [Massilia sp. H27-R4]CUI05174.1 Transcriptional regulator, TetR family [Janthinobacterium sp. CG23_2]CUU28960.1 Transcriptional regulator, TetR family [Janthinobacterium sp. CG23_2]
MMTAIPAPPVPAAKSAGRPRACELEARHNNLIETAGQLMLKHGYGKVSLETIAREAHVAVRTIYVKFGGKAGLFQAVLKSNRSRFFAANAVEQDMRPLKQVISEFSLQFFDMISAPEALSMQRMVIAEAPSNPELSASFYEAGPRQTREMLMRYFARPDIRSQLREDLALELIPTFLLNCVQGEYFGRFLFQPAPQAREDVVKALEQRLDLFYRSVLRAP